MIRDFSSLLDICTEIDGRKINLDTIVTIKDERSITIKDGLEVQTSNHPNTSQMGYNHKINKNK